MNRKFVQIKDYSFSEFLLGLEKFFIPSFQRPYNWQYSQVENFWKSLAREGSDCFMGNVVLLDKAGEQGYAVVDGHQRLITASLFLAAASRELSKIKDETVCRKVGSDLRRLFFYKEKLYPFNEAPRVCPAKPNAKAVYLGLVSGKISPYDQKNFIDLDENQLCYLKNYRLICRLAASFCEGRIDRIEEMIAKICRSVLITVICRSDTDAYVMFEGLNSGGNNLSAVDLLKSGLLSLARLGEERDEIESRWNKIENDFARGKFSLLSSFFHQHWMCFKGFVSRSVLLEEIKTELSSAPEKNACLSFVVKAAGNSRVYSALRFDRHREWLLRKIEDKVKDKNVARDLFVFLKKFECLKVETIFVLLLCYVNKFLRGKGYSVKSFKRDLKRLWIFGFRARVLGVSGVEYEKEMADFCPLFLKTNGSRLDKLSLDFYGKLKILVADKGEFTANFPYEIRYGKDSELITYVLNEIFKKQNPEIELSRPTIEHILPRQIKKSGLGREEISLLIDTVGNLTLLSQRDNLSSGNMNVRDKAEKIYSRSAFKLNKDLAKQADEFEENADLAVKKRGEELARLVEEIFSF